MSHGRPGANVLGLEPATQRLLNSNYKRAQAIVAHDPRVSLVSQGPSDFYDMGDNDYSQIVATRLPNMNEYQMQRARDAATVTFKDDPAAQEAEYQRRLAAWEGRVVGGLLPNHKKPTPNRTLVPDEIFKDLTRKYDSGQRNLVIDEIAAGTAPQVTTALQRVALERPEILDALSVYMTAGPGSGPKAFSPGLIKLLANRKVRTYAELYGGKAGHNWTDKQWAQSADAMQRFRDAGVNMTPMMSLSGKHIGSGPEAIAEAQRRAWYIFNKTGFIPSVWHMTAAKAPSPLGMGSAVERWIKKMRTMKVPRATVEPQLNPRRIL